MSVETSLAQSVDFTSSNLPIVVIETGGVEIPDEPKIPAHMGIFRSGGDRTYVDSAFTDFSGPIAIELRGNSSLYYEQKQYLFKTLDPSGEDLNVSLMEFPSEHDWILYAPFVDKSLMRNVLVYELARDLGWYASRTRFCELLLDGRYQGVYVLMEQIKRDKNRVNISKLEPDVLTGEPVTGGYIFAIDHSGKPTDKGFPGAFDSTGYFVYWYIYPSSKNINIQQEWFIQSYVGAFEDVMMHPAFSDPIRGYSAFINVASFVDYILINEWANNVDGFVASLYLHKDRQSKGGKIVAGPVWDFNIAFGNADYDGASLTTGWRIHHGRVPFWWRRLLQDPAFVDRLEHRWKEIRGSVLHGQRLDAMIDSLASHLDEAQQRHFQRWDLLGTTIWPNAFVGETFAEEIDYIKLWIRSRMTWMDENIGTIGLPLENTGTTSVAKDTRPSTHAIEVYPSPTNGSAAVAYRLPEPASVQVVVRDALGRIVHSSKTTRQSAGAHSETIHLTDQPNGLYQAVLLTNGLPRAAASIVLVK